METNMHVGRLGTWYAIDKLTGLQRIKQFAATVERLDYDVLCYPEALSQHRSVAHVG